MQTLRSKASRILVFAAVLGALAAHLGSARSLDEQLTEQLGSAKYVYLSSERKSGEWSEPAEIWFLWDQGSVWVGTKPSTWRVRRIKAGRTKARIAIGKVDGPTFEATGAVVKDAAIEAKLMETYAKKYPDGWKSYEPSFRDGWKSGERVLVRYTPR